MAEPTSPPRRLVRLLFGAVVLGGPLLVLGAGEAWVRSTREPVDLLALTGRRPAPHSLARTAMVGAFEAYRGRPGAYGDGKTVNSHGFISTPELAVAKPPGTVRIAFLGGSSTAGTGTDLPDSVTWPWQVADLLRRRHPGLRLEFINAALAGYTSFESYGRLWSRLRFYQPDVLVLMHAWNEMYYFSVVDSIAFWRTLPDGTWRFDPIPGRPGELAPRWMDPLIHRSQLLSRVRIRFTRPAAGEREGRAAPRALADHYDGRGIEIWRTNLRLIRDAARRFGADLYVVRQPTLIVPGLPEAERRRCNYALHGFDHDAHVDAFRRIYQVIADEIAADHVIPLDSLSGRPALFTDHVHPTPAGARAYAEGVAAAIDAAVVARAAALGRDRPGSGRRPEAGGAGAAPRPGSAM